MTTRKVLIIAPALVVLFLIQSYFWVPSYEEQTRGNPERLEEYITASIGDASILNPILSADSASSDIISMVFEGLIDRDEELRFRGRLATSWDLYEEAFFYVNEEAEIPGVGRASPEEVAALIEKARSGALPLGPEVRVSLEGIKEISVLPAREFTVTRKTGQVPGAKKAPPIPFAVSAPPRIKLVLEAVDQDLFDRLTTLLGEDYFAGFPAAGYVRPEQGGAEGTGWNAREILPAVEHNPVIVFHLRPDVRFHDGHLFDAGDVKFTYEAIMDPRNLSPRLADYEPVKTVRSWTP
jgi:ABC-type transport system substrate-binding protein